ncbi:hypothetical protein PFISCL1PPCAC_21917, partial [Pristionchus fissidentatus]
QPMQQLQQGVAAPVGSTNYHDPYHQEPQQFEMMPARRYDSNIGDSMAGLNQAMTAESLQDPNGFHDPSSSTYHDSGYHNGYHDGHPDGSPMNEDHHPSVSFNDRPEVTHFDREENERQGHDVRSATIQEEEKRDYRDMWHGAYKKVCKNLGFK